MILNELTIALDDNIDNVRIYKELRLSIIHGQICLASFFKYKRDVKDRQTKLANEKFR